MDENIKIIYRILKTLEKAMDIEEFDIAEISAERLKISETRWTRIIEMLCRNELIQGIGLQYGATGSVVLTVSNPRITLKGIEYLNDNSLMKRAHNAMRGVVEIIPGL